MGEEKKVSGKKEGKMKYVVPKLTKLCGDSAKGACSSGGLEGVDCFSGGDANSLCFTGNFPTGN